MKTIQRKRRIQSSLIHYKLGLALHRKFYMHLLILVIINLLVVSIVIGISSQLYPLVKVNSIGVFLLGIVLFTFIEVLSKILMVRFLYGLVILTFGLLFFIINAMSFLFDINFYKIYHFLYEETYLFTLIFMMVRLLFQPKKIQWIKGAYNMVHLKILIRPPLKKVFKFKFKNRWLVLVTPCMLRMLSRPGVEFAGSRFF